MTSHKPFSLLFLFMLGTCLHASAQVKQADIVPMVNRKPVEVAVDLALYKIYNINTVAETFEVDGYLHYTWKDARMAYDVDSVGLKTIKYSNDRLDDVIKEDVWFPVFEFINTQGRRETSFHMLEISPKGEMNYLERFHGVFSQEMNYEKFPFDNQDLMIQMEPFSHNATEVVFSDTEEAIFHSATKEGQIECTNWTLSNLRTHNSLTIGALEEGDMTDSYDRLTFTVNANRMSGYYIWQLLFPLMIILLASVVIFWINDFGSQIGTGFTLMLTVVAYNFYSETLLPKLPYNTYIEVIIMLGYIFILLSIIATLHNNYSSSKDEGKGKKLRKLYRIFYPVCFFAAMVITTLYYFG